MNLYTPEQAAEILHVTPDFVKTKCRKKELGCHRLSRKTILISPDHIKDYLESTECQRKTKENTSNTEKTADGGESLNISTETDIGTLAAARAKKKLTQHLQCSNSKNVVQISQSER